MVKATCGHCREEKDFPELEVLVSMVVLCEPCKKEIEDKVNSKVKQRINTEG